MIRVKCPACEREFELPEFLAGLSAVCKNCRQPIPVPARANVSPDGGATASTLAYQPPPPTRELPPSLPEPAPPVRTRADLDMPGWEIDRARALLESGVNVAEIERRLIADGLPAEAATAVVEKALEERVRKKLEPVARAEGRQRIHRVLSVLMAASYTFLVYWHLGFLSAFRFGIGLLLPVACIWFPDAMGKYTSRYSFNRETMGVFVLWGGWLVLIVVGVLPFIL